MPKVILDMISKWGNNSCGHDCCLPGFRSNLVLTCPQGQSKSPKQTWGVWRCPLPGHQWHFAEVQREKENWACCQVLAVWSSLYFGREPQVLLGAFPQVHTDGVPWKLIAQQSVLTSFTSCCFAIFGWSDPPLGLHFISFIWRACIGVMAVLFFFDEPDSRERYYFPGQKREIGNAEATRQSFHCMLLPWVVHISKVWH